ncbi:uncharacterized protein LOC132066022 [Lycium ferocissimum]|uniref:uncharacterized protein LOC132066022 n=1 Tax=Lycium ferocissimum TaxID=112874 RepID=UPI0028157AE8|nr:uncharacterized protein LOC132066022 [Lycium ferocissimum]
MTRKGQSTSSSKQFENATNESKKAGNAKRISIIIFRSLVFHPNGNKNKNKAGNYVSVYLMMAEATSLAPAGWEVHAAFRLSICLIKTTKVTWRKNQVFLITTTDTSSEKGRRFHAMKVEWGFDRFMSQEAFNNPENGYVVDDKCVLGAEVYVCQEKIRGRGDCLSMVKDPISYKHTWKIEKFSALTADCEDSETFMAGEHKWKIQLYPKGKGSGTILDTGRTKQPFSG